MNLQKTYCKNSESNFVKTINSLGIGFIISLGMFSVTNTFAHDGGYVSDNYGNVVRDGNGDCVKAALGNHFPECEPKLTAIQPTVKPKPVPAPVVIMKPKPIKVVKPKPVAKPRPMPKPRMITKVLSLNESAGANFGFDKDNLTRNAQMKLSEFANDIMRSNINPSTVTVIGHTDGIGSQEYNRKLSQRRANSVASYFANKGINRSIMQVSGRGELQPIADNKTKIGRAKNRRVDISVMGQRKITIRQ